ncbi:hypothetical protein ACM91E_27925 [Escherichia coli]|uniref:hypothetical protein n=1 Tax=Escherichia coli TaxID=562 RepID=UPI003B99BC13
MSDWSLYELDDIVWDVFGDSSERIVPHPDVEQLNGSKIQCVSYKKARHDLVGSVERNPPNNGSTEENIFLENEGAGDCSLFTAGNTQTAEHSLSHASKKPVLPVSLTSTCTENAVNLTLGNTRTAGSLFSAQKGCEDQKEFCADEHVLEDTSVADKSSQECISISIPPPDSDLDFLINEPETVENGDILDYEWPDIGNFEDVDRMLSNGFSQFGQQSSGTANELSWFSSSSYAIDGSEECLGSGFQSSYADLSALGTPLEHNEGPPQNLEHNEGNMMDWSGNGETTVSNHKSSRVTYGPSGCWLDANPQGEEGFSSKGMLNSFYGTNGSKTSAQAQVTNDNSISSCEGSNSVSMPRDISKCTIPQSEGRKKVQNSEYVGGNFYHSSIPVAQSTERTIQSRCSSVAGQPNSMMGTDSSSSPCSYDSQLEITKSHSSQMASMKCLKDDIKANIERKAFSLNSNVAVPPNQGHQLKQEKPNLVSPLTDRQKMEEKHHGPQLQGRVAIGKPPKHAASQGLLSSECLSQGKLVKSENYAEGEMEEAHRDILNFETNHCSAQENLPSLWSKNNLPGPTSLRHLQDVMDQLDLRIKLCIRDGLYRLAKNARQRHGANGAIPGCKAAIQGMGMDASKRCPGFMDVETGTNPIDRSIAHLLFYRASEQSLIPANDALSFESQVVL